MQVRLEAWLWMGSLIAVAAAAAFAQAPAPSPPPAVATVGDRRIARAEFEQRAAQALREFGARGGQPLSRDVESLLERQVLESMIRRELLVLEARRRGMAGSEAQAIEILKREPVFSPGGRFDEARWNAIRTTQPAEFARVLGDIRATLAAQELGRRLEAEHTPKEADLRARAARAGSRARIEFVALRRGDFTGSYPEPREAEVLERWRAESSRHRRPARATVSLIGVLADGGLPADAGRAREASERLRRRADSLLAALRSGGDWSQAAQAMNHERTGLTVLPDNFPGDWAGDEADRAAVFRAAPGSLLERPVRARSGWFVVRVDDATPAREARLAEVAPEIRSRLRNEARDQSAERELRALFATQRDSMALPAVRVRWVLVDTAAVDPGSPKSGDLERYYRGHLADYSTFDNVQGRVVETPLADVRDDVARRWRSDRRLELARARAARIEEAWRRGRRDAAAEKGLAVQDGGPLVPGMRLDATPAGRVVSDSVARRDGALGTGVARLAAGPVVFHVRERVERHHPTFEQARPMLEALAADRRQREAEAGARALFDADPSAFATGSIVHSTRMVVPPPTLIDIPLTRREVERWHQANIDRYSAPEQVRASHILIAPRGDGDEAHRVARARADSLLRVLQGGADFAQLARRVSDDEPTRDSGGELGTFGHGVVLEELERAAFAMRSGDLSDVIRSPAGYHILKVHEYLPPVVQPMITMYTNVASDLAMSRSDTLARQRADSLRRSLRSVADARATGRRLGLEMIPVQHERGVSPRVESLTAYFAGLDALPPGRLYPEPVFVRGQGWVVSWVDSVSPPRAPTWEAARTEAMSRWTREAGRRALDAKRAELDSLERSGFSPDSIAALLGGWESLPQLAPRSGLPGLGGAAIVDSLVFGTASRPAALAAGGTSEWVALTNGHARLRVVGLEQAEAGTIETRVDAERRAALDYNLHAAYERLKLRFPVRILDARLREIDLPPPPAPRR